MFQSRWFLYFLTFGLLVVGCRSATAITPTADTLLAGSHGQFSMATPLPTVAPISSSTPAPMMGLQFHIGGEGQSLATPVPIAPPEDAPAGYELKDWSELDGLEAIGELETYARASDICSLFGCVRSGLQGAQEPIRLILEETISRFPRMGPLQALRWRLALADAILEDPSVDDWLLAAIEGALNQGLTTPETIGEFLSRYGFVLNASRTWSFETAPNLFGDGLQSWVYKVQTQNEWTSDGLIFAVALEGESRYRTVPVYSNWQFNQSIDEIVEVADHTRNGVPEVVVLTGSFNGSMCFAKLLIFEWNGAYFAELTRGAIRYSECGVPPTNWRYDAPDEDGIETVVIVDFDDNLIERYGWNGQFYELSEYYGPPLSPGLLSYGVNDSDIQVGEIEARIKEFQFYLDEWSMLDQDIRDDMGTAYPDYVRFQLGVAHTLDSDSAAARATLQDLADNPSDPAYPLVSVAAQAFLRVYEGDASQYRACLAALEVMEGPASSARDALGNIDDDAAVQGAWGYNPDARFHLCNLRDAFPLLVMTVVPGPMPSDPVSLIRQAGAEVHHAEGLDLDGDADTDWLLFLKFPVGYWGPPNLSLWALFNTERGVRPQYLESIDNDVMPDLNDPLRVEAAVPSNGSRPLVIVRAGQLLTVYVLDAKDANFKQVLYESDLRRYSVSPGETRVDLEVTANSDWYSGPLWQVYRWDQEAGRFGPVDRLAELILDEGRLEDALVTLQSVLSELQGVEDPELSGIPRFMYLLGLAYELSGDEADAVEAYWRLWSDFPGSGYAILARSKLVLESRGP